jgi:hypothetical protein
LNVVEKQIKLENALEMVHRECSNRMRALLNQTQRHRERGKERGLSAGRRDEGTALGIQNREDRDSEGGQLRRELERGILERGIERGEKGGDRARNPEQGQGRRTTQVGRHNWKQWRQEDRIGSGGGKKNRLCESLV